MRSRIKPAAARWALALAIFLGGTLPYASVQASSTHHAATTSKSAAKPSSKAKTKAPAKTPAKSKTKAKSAGNALAEPFKAALAKAEQSGPLSIAEVDAAAATDSAALRRLALYDYIVAARLRHTLVHPTAEADARVEAFVAEHGDQPSSRALRRDWLDSLASRGRWTQLLNQKVSSAEDKEIPAFACPRLQARLQQLPAATAPDFADRVAVLRDRATQLWISSPNNVAASAVLCGPAFDWLRDQGGISTANTEARVRNAMLAGNVKLARSYYSSLPVNLTAGFDRWASFLDAPIDKLNGLTAMNAETIDPAAMLPVFDKFSHKNTQSAKALYAVLDARAQAQAQNQGPADTASGVIPPGALYDAATLAAMRRSVAVALALDHEADAIPMFASIPESALDTAGFEWRVRAALWQGQWALVRDWINRMPADLAGQPRWRYWHARATEALGDSAAAKTEYAAVANERDYYSYLAADRINQPYQLNHRPSADDPALRAKVENSGGVQRTREFLDFDMAAEAGSEWNYTVRNLSAAEQVQAAKIAMDWQWYWQAIPTLVKANEWNDVRLRYPRPYAGPVSAAMKASGLPEAWIYAIMRQESLYQPDTRSSADALGLLQVLPSGAKEIAQREHLPAPTRQQLFEPATGVMFGALELHEKFEDQGHQLARTFAAYNAGPGAVNRWLPPAPMDSDIWSENIPYQETRSYVQRVLEHLVAFSWVIDGKPERITPWLGPILPRGSAAVASNP